jgi:hypothetical protein
MVMVTSVIRAGANNRDVYKGRCYQIHSATFPITMRFAVRTIAA